mgnify:FL=1
MKIKHDDRIDPQDWRFVPADPDPDFDADHNRQVIDRTIKKSEAYRRKKMRQFNEGVGQRSEAIATYLQSVKAGGKTSDVDKFFGRRELARLRGQEVLGIIKNATQK